MPHYDGQIYADFKTMLMEHRIVEADDVEAETYQFRLRNNKIEYRRKRGGRWSQIGTYGLSVQFLIGSNVPRFARVG